MLSVTLCLLLLAPARASGVEPFVFQVPDGWTDLSSAVPESELPPLPPEIAAQRRQTPVLAMDLAGADDGFAENMNVVLTDGGGRVDQEVVDQVARTVVEKGLAAGATTRLVSAKVEPIGGIDCGRIETETSGAYSLHQVAWLLPGEPKSAIATYTAAPDRFDEYVATFDESARATTGMKASSRSGRIGRSALRGGLIGGAVALVIALVRKMSGRS